MIRFLTKFLFLAFAVGFVSSISNNAQDSTIPFGWKKVSICNLNFIAPDNLKNENAKGIDSCVGVFSGNKIDVTLDYGLYGDASRKYETYVDFKEEIIEIDGKKAQLATYRDTQMSESRNFNVRIYVALGKTKLAGVKMTKSLNMTIIVENAKDLEMAKQIIKSIRFDK